MSTSTTQSAGARRGIFLRRISLTQWIVISMFLGIYVGYCLPEFSQNLRVISNIFLKLIKCLITPLLFSTLVVGVAGHTGDLRSVGRMAFKAILYFEVVTTLALVVGLFVVNWAQPGVGVKLPPPAAAATAAPQEPPPKITFSTILEHAVPQSFFDAAARNDVLQVVVFSLLFAMALAQVPGKPRETMVHFCEALAEVMFKLVGLIMLFAPFGIGAAMAVAVGHSGFEVLKNLFKLVATLYAALAVFCVCVLVPVAVLIRLPLRRFLRTVRAPALVAFSTTSSDAALPDAMKRMIAFGVPKRIVSFVMPLGYSFNLDGSTLYLAVASVFVAQAAGVTLSLGQQLTIMMMLMLTSKGIAGVPRASQVVLAGTLTHFGLPLEGILLIMSVDELMDMARTTVNLVGNCLATAVVARWEGELNIPPEDPPEPLPTASPS